MSCNRTPFRRIDHIDIKEDMRYYIHPRVAFQQTVKARSERLAARRNHK